MALKHAPRIVTDGLVLALDAANPKSYPGSGTTWKDLSGNGNDGTLTNGPTFSGNNAGSVAFDGSNDYTILPSSNTLTGDNLQTITISCWTKFTSSSRGYIFSIKRLSTASTLITLLANGNNTGAAAAGHLGFLTRNNANTAHTYMTYNDSYNDGNWYQVLATVNQLSRKLYINGDLIDEDSDGMQSVTGNTAVTTLGSFNNSSDFFNGNISQAHIYNRALSAEEVLQNYNATKSRFYDI